MILRSRYRRMSVRLCVSAPTSKSARSFFLAESRDSTSAVVEYGRDGAAGSDHELFDVRDLVVVESASTEMRLVAMSLDTADSLPCRAFGQCNCDPWPMAACEAVNVAFKGQPGVPQVRTA